MGNMPDKAMVAWLLSVLTAVHSTTERPRDWPGRALTASRPGADPVRPRPASNATPETYSAREAPLSELGPACPAGPGGSCCCLQDSSLRGYARDCTSGAEATGGIYAERSIHGHDAFGCCPIGGWLPLTCTPPSVRRCWRSWPCWSWSRRSWAALCLPLYALISITDLTWLQYGCRAGPRSGLGFHEEEGGGPWGLGPRGLVFDGLTPVAAASRWPYSCGCLPAAQLAPGGPEGGPGAVRALRSGR